MDSINKNQQEENVENLSNAKARDKIKELTDKKTCFFNTAIGSEESVGVRPMSVQKIDEEGNLWFLSPTDSHKNMEISLNSNVKLFFQGSNHSDFLFIEGTASITLDKTITKQLWEPVLKTWFTEGEDDPRISAIKFSPVSGYYWDNKHGNVLAGIKIIIGAAIGKTMDDSIEGNIHV